MRKLRIGTRGSRLALRQAEEVRQSLLQSGVDSELIAIKTTGDRRRDAPLANIGGKGVFIKEIEEALDRGEVDLAVHSLKDIPSIISPRFSLVAFLPREDPRDAWLHPRDIPIEKMPEGAIVGTSSPRRRVQLLQRYPQLIVREMRGNVDSRIAKLSSGHYDGIVLATAGLRRLGRDREITTYFSVSEMVPAAGQGVIAMEVSAERLELPQLLRQVNDPKTEQEARCERAILASFGELLDCHSAIGVHAYFDGRIMTIHAFLGDLDGTGSIRVTCSGASADELVAAVAKEMRRQGAIELLSKARQASQPKA